MADEKLDRSMFSNPSMGELRGRQSVRATFKLSAECINAISIVAAHLGIKQKSLFDHLAEDIEYLEAVAQDLADLRLSPRDRVQKTFVISRKSLISLDKISRMHNAPRDALVEYSVQRLLPIIRKEKERHLRRKKYYEQLLRHQADGEKLLLQLQRAMGEDDPLCRNFESVMGFYKSASSKMESFIERASIIEEFDPDELRKHLKSL